LTDNVLGRKTAYPSLSIDRRKDFYEIPTSRQVIAFSVSFVLDNGLALSRRVFLRLAVATC